MWPLFAPGPGGSLPGRAAILFAKAVLGLAITSLVAGLATGLFSAHHFHRLAGNGVLANVLAMPLVTFVVMPAGVLSLLSMPFGLDQWPLRLMGKGLEGVIWTARYVESLGGDIVVGAESRARLPWPQHRAVREPAGAYWSEAGCGLAEIALIGLGAVLALPAASGSRPRILISGRWQHWWRCRPLNGLVQQCIQGRTRYKFRQWQMALSGPTP